MSASQVPHLSGRDFRGRNFDGAALAGVDLRACDLTDASFVQCDLSHALMMDVDVAGTDFSGANMRGVDLRRCSGHGLAPRFVGANLSGADLRFSELDSVDARDSILNDVEIEGASLVGGDFTRAEMRRVSARWPRSFLSQVVPRGSVSLHRAVLDDADLTGSVLPGAQLDESSMRRANASQSFMTAASLRDVDMVESSFDEADLCLADLSGSSARGARFRDAALVETLFNRTDLRGADFQGAIAVATIMHGARTDAATCGSEPRIDRYRTTAPCAERDDDGPILVVRGALSDVGIALRERARSWVPPATWLAVDDMQSDRVEHLANRLRPWFPVTVRLDVEPVGIANSGVEIRTRLLFRDGVEEGRWTHRLSSPETAVTDFYPVLTEALSRAMRQQETT